MSYYGFHDHAIASYLILRPLDRVSLNVPSFIDRYYDIIQEKARFFSAAVALALFLAVRFLRGEFLFLFFFRPSDSFCFLFSKPKKKTIFHHE